MNRPFPPSGQPDHDASHHGHAKPDDRRLRDLPNDLGPLSLSTDDPVALDNEEISCIVSDSKEKDPKAVHSLEI